MVPWAFLTACLGVVKAYLQRKKEAVKDRMKLALKRASREADTSEVEDEIKSLNLDKPDSE